MALNLKPLPEFNPDGEVGSSLAARWRLWLSDFDTFLIASGLRDASRKRALLLYQAGSRVREIFHQLEDVGTDADYDKARDKLTAYFEPQKNQRYEVYKFRQTRQEEGETLDKFHTRLRNLSSNCEFTNPDFEIEQQILTGGSSSKIRRRALRDPDYKLKDMLLDGRRDEMSSYQAKDIESKSEETLVTNRFQTQQTKPKANKERKCYNCGGAWPHEHSCPAKGKVCRKCQKNDHFARVCRSKNKTKGQASNETVSKQESNKKNLVKPLQHHDDTDNESSAEIFQHALQQSLQGIHGVRNIADDIIVHGKSREEHDTALRNCLKRLQEKGLTLNAKKCSFLQPTLEFFGQIFSAEGTRPDPKRVTDLQNMPTPTNAQEVRSLLGMANYSSKYIRNYATITSPLRELTKKNVRFSWTEIHHNAFTELKDALIAAPMMGYFDISKSTTITVDASPVGISAILAQGTDSDYKVIAYASRALTDVEKRYSQTEKEALSIVWGIEHFHLYLYGKEFTLITDHKPLEIIYGTPTSKPSARIERWVLRLQPYRFVVQYKAGADNPADYLSRHPVPNNNPSHIAEETEEFINFVTKYAVPKAMTIDEISEATNADRTLQGLRAAIRTGHWETVKQYKPIKDEITVGSNNIILRGSRIIIPDALRQRAIDIAHESHQGISKTKALLREKVWFFGMDELVQETLESCLACQAVGKPAPPAPLQQIEMPNAPWEQVHVDYCGPVPTGEYLLVVIDRYSRFPEVAIVNSTKSSSLFIQLDRIFAVHGIPELIISDNGPPFNSDEFSRYVTAIGSRHHPITPRWPQANGEVEKFNQPLEKTIQAAVVEGKVWKQELQRFLLQYRTTPHCTTKVAPCELLFNRQVRGKLPILKRKSIVNKHKIARENEEKTQKYQKNYIDKRRNAKESDISVGDTVLVKQQYKNKFSSRFDKTPYTVILRKGTMITAENDTRRITRNVSHFKKFNARVDRQEEFDSDVEQDLNRGDNQAEQELEHVHEHGNNTRRQSTRARTQPVRYGDPVPSRLIP